MALASIAASSSPPLNVAVLVLVIGSLMARRGQSGWCDLAGRKEPGAGEVRRALGRQEAGLAEWAGLGRVSRPSPRLLARAR